MSTEEKEIFSLLTTPPVVEDKTIKCEDIYKMFHSDRRISCIVLLEQNKPIGLITRVNFMLNNSGAFGYSLHQKKPAIKFTTKEFLSVDITHSLPATASLAMHRDDEHTYDPVVVTDTASNYIGCIEIKALLLRSSQLELEYAMNSNPLTGLPGNKSINKWIENSLAYPEYAIIYGDLSNFKEYNDTYGFSNGDNVIKLAAQIMQQHQSAISSAAKVGHIGGDDYIIVVTGSLSQTAVAQICQDFDQQVKDHFKTKHIRNGGYEAKNRQGVVQFVPITTLNLSVISNQNFEYTPSLAEISRAAANLKKTAKAQAQAKGCSCVVYERRTYTLKAKLKDIAQK